MDKWFKSSFTHFLFTMYKTRGAWCETTQDLCCYDLYKQHNHIKTNAINQYNI